MNEKERHDLIRRCDRGIVPEQSWSNRDSSAAQRQLGEARALLAAGCDFLPTSTNGPTDWIVIYYRGFNYFEYGHDTATDDEQFYIPTDARMDEVAGEDWYR